MTPRTGRRMTNEQEIEHGIRSTATRVAESVRHLDGGAEYAAIFMRDVHPHESRMLPEPMRLNRHRITSAIEFLSAVWDALPTSRQLEIRTGVFVDADSASVLDHKAATALAMQRVKNRSAIGGLSRRGR